ncbi:mapk-regulated corepressor-interacting protein 1 isoform X2 [Rhineura floridana]|uniref:mapk-regulated corepressor-interacting protein 1 isoform X2 n=1 Tax=Rhineura floridana TaxID=261503 RepID=UPI002AC7F231|nr:mapk-regulated corepressor-interacting protein 1 isoform X2 [Rhineura floridana]
MMRPFLTDPCGISGPSSAMPTLHDCLVVVRARRKTSPIHTSSAWARAGEEATMTSSPVSRVVYNGKRNSSPRSPSNSSEIFTPAHEENVRFISEAWQCVERDLRSQMAGGERGLVEEYVEKMPNPSLKAFRPVDLSDLKRRNTQDAKKS